MNRALVGLVFVGLVVVSGIATAEEAKFEYNGYWRLGVNASGNFLEDAPDTQGYGQFGELKTSRHTRGPSYFWLRVARIFENQMQAVIKIDSNATLPHEYGNWGDADTNVIQVRDLYLQLPLAQDSYIWAGARVFEFEDIRLFDYLNWFNVNAHGVGGKFGNAQVILSFAKETLDESKLQFTDASGAPATPTDDPATPDNEGSIEASRRNTTLMARYELNLGEGMSIKPMLKLDHFGSIPEDKGDPALVQKEVKGADQFSIGGVVSRSDPTAWQNLHLWISSVPADTTGATNKN